MIEETALSTAQVGARSSFLHSRSDCVLWILDLYREWPEYGHAKTMAVALTALLSSFKLAGWKQGTGDSEEDI